MERKDIINNLIKGGAESVKGLKVKNVTVTPQENYVRVALTLDKSVKGMINKDNKWIEGETNIIFISIFSITSILKDDDNAAFAANHIIKHPDSLSVLLSSLRIAKSLNSISVT